MPTLSERIAAGEPRVFINGVSPKPEKDRDGASDITISLGPEGPTVHIKGVPGEAAEAVTYRAISAIRELAAAKVTTQAKSTSSLTTFLAIVGAVVILKLLWEVNLIIA